MVEAGLPKVKKPICILEPYKNQVIYYDGKFKEKPKTKNCFSASYVRLQDLNSAVISLDEIPDSELYEAIELKANEELSLSFENEYKIIYKEAKNLNQLDRYFNIFVSTHQKLQTLFAAHLTPDKYIDFISPIGLLYDSLYDLELLPKSGVECFIYFQKDDANMSVYQDGNFIFSKQIEQNLSNLYVKFLENCKKEISFDEFCDFLTSNSHESLENDVAFGLSEVFGDTFLQLEDTFGYLKKTFGFHKLDNIFISSEYGKISNISEYTTTYLGLEGKGFDFLDIFKDEDIDDLSKLLTLSAISYQKKPNLDTNLSIFQRPPSFFDTKSGKLFLVFASSFVLFAIYPAYLAMQTYLNEQEKIILKNELSILEKNTQALKDSTKKLNDEISQQTSEVEKYQKNFAKMYTTLEKMVQKKESFSSRTSYLLDIFLLINKTEAKIVSSDLKDDKISLDLQSKTESDIAKFLSLVSKDERFFIKTKQISKMENGLSYISTLEIFINE